MRQLHFVGPGEDSTYVVVQDLDGDEQFSLIADDDLRAALRNLPWPKAQPAPAAAPSSGRSDVMLTPRDIQVRVRAGESPEALALEAGVSTDRIQRFAYAVIQERLRITSEARRARSRRGGPDGEYVPFGETVDARFEAHGIANDSVSWDAVRVGDGPWTVTASWLGGDVSRRASWTFLLGARTLVPDDDTAMELLSDRPVTRPTPQVIDPPQAASLPAAPADAGNSNVRRLPPRPDDQFYDQDAQDADAFTAPITPLASFFAPPAADVDDGALFPTPAIEEQDELVLIEADEPAAGEGLGPENDDSRSARGRVPSWDDILLGVRRKQD